MGENCDDSMSKPLLVTFKDSCNSSCQLNKMQEANIDKSDFSQTSLGIIILNEFTDEQLAALRGETESIETNECNGDVSTTEVPLENCDDSMRMPLLITFKDTCSAACQSGVMQEANIDKTKFEQTSVGIIMLNEATDEQLTALRGKTESIKAIECDGTVSTTEVPLENCDDSMSKPLLVTFKDSCNSSCQLNKMQEANIDKSDFSQTSLGIIFLNEFT